MTGIVVPTARAANEISRLAQVANTTPGTLQRWSATSKSVGIEQEKLADILKDVNDKVGDFLSTGGGEMKDFFEKIAPKVGGHGEGVPQSVGAAGAAALCLEPREGRRLAGRDDLLHGGHRQ
ncbi:hypothetical protein GQR99_01135 [Cereibacter sphaeroides]|nr:hypothetical protein GQR99_01135 [Cereibacter sphaeroides]